MFSGYDSIRMATEAILALHMADLADKIACVTHFHPAFAAFPLPAQKAVLDLSCQGISEVKRAQTMDHYPARIHQRQAWLAEADTLDNAAGRGIYAPPPPHH